MGKFLGYFELKGGSKLLCSVSAPKQPKRGAVLVLPGNKSESNGIFRTYGGASLAGQTVRVVRQDGRFEGRIPDSNVNSVPRYIVKLVS